MTMIRPLTTSKIVDDFEWCRRTHASAESHFWEALTAASMDAPEILELTAGVQPGQPHNWMLLTAVSYLLEDTPDHPLAEYHPAMRDHPKPADQAFPAFRSFCMDNAEHIRALAATRTVQATSPNRCFILVPAMCRVAQDSGEPFALIEIGCSAGLILQMDRYAYDFGPAGLVGPHESPVRISGVQLGAPLPSPLRLPTLSRKVGIDLSPISAADPDARRWIMASIFPEWAEERRQIQAALELQVNQPDELVKGSALEVLPDLLKSIVGPVCILHSVCLYQWPDATKAALDGMLRDASRTHAISRLSLEPRYRVDIEPQDRFPARSLQSPLFLSRTIYRDGDESEEFWGRQENFGKWLEWAA